MKNKGQSCQQLQGQSYWMKKPRQHTHLWSNVNEALRLKQVSCLTWVCRAEALGFASEWLLFQIFIKTSNQQGFHFLYEELAGYFLYTTRQQEKYWSRFFDPPHRKTRWHRIFHLLLVVFSRMVQGKAWKKKTTFIFELSKMLRNAAAFKSCYVRNRDLFRMLTCSADISI